MRRLLLIVCFVFLSVPARAAGGPKGLGLGVVVGGTTGLTGKFFMTDIHAIDAAFGGGEGYVAYVWHGWQAFEKQPPRARLAAMLGLGARVEQRGGRDKFGNERDDEIGIRGTIGAAAFLSELPLEITFEVNPVVNFTGDSGTDLDFALAVRYYFTRFN